jgi:hypothetical protein
MKELGPQEYPVMNRALDDVIVHDGLAPGGRKFEIRQDAQFADDFDAVQVAVTQGESPTR